MPSGPPPNRRLLLEFHDHRIVARLWQSQVLALELRVDPAPQRGGVARFTFWSGTPLTPLATGFVGLGADGRGQVSLDGFDPTLPGRIISHLATLALVVELPPLPDPARDRPGEHG
jgi:hypothetical protein